MSFTRTTANGKKKEQVKVNEELVQGKVYQYNDGTDKPKDAKYIKTEASNAGTPQHQFELSNFGIKVWVQDSDLGTKIVNGNEQSDKEVESATEALKMFEGNDEITKITFSGIRSEWGGGYMIGGTINGERRVNKVKKEDVNKFSTAKGTERIDLVKKYLIDEFDPEMDKHLKTKEADLKVNESEQNPYTKDFISLKTVDQITAKQMELLAPDKIKNLTDKQVSDILKAKNDALDASLDKGNLNEAKYVFNPKDLYDLKKPEDLTEYGKQNNLVFADSKDGNKTVTGDQSSIEQMFVHFKGSGIMVNESESTYNKIVSSFPGHAKQSNPKGSKENDWHQSVDNFIKDPKNSASEKRKLIDMYYSDFLGLDASEEDEDDENVIHDWEEDAKFRMSELNEAKLADSEVIPTVKAEFPDLDEKQVDYVANELSSGKAEGLYSRVSFKLFDWLKTTDKKVMDEIVTKVFKLGKQLGRGPAYESESVAQLGELDKEQQEVITTWLNGITNTYIASFDKPETLAEVVMRKFKFGQIYAASVIQFIKSWWDKNYDKIVNEGYDVEVELRDAQKAQDIFNDQFKKIGKAISTNTYSFKNEDDLFDFVETLKSQKVGIISDELIANLIKNGKISEGKKTELVDSEGNFAITCFDDIPMINVNVGQNIGDMKKILQTAGIKFGEQTTINGKGLTFDNQSDTNKAFELLKTKLKFSVWEKLNENDGADLAANFKDTKGKNPKIGDLISDEDKNIGKVQRFYKEDNKHTTNGYRMVVDYRSEIVELNPNNKFEIIENPDEKLKKAFEVKVVESLQSVKDEVWKSLGIKKGEEIDLNWVRDNAEKDYTDQSKSSGKLIADDIKFLVTDDKLKVKLFVKDGSKKYIAGDFVVESKLIIESFMNPDYAVSAEASKVIDAMTSPARYRKLGRCLAWYNDRNNTSFEIKIDELSQLYVDFGDATTPSDVRYRELTTMLNYFGFKRAKVQNEKGVILGKPQDEEQIDETSVRTCKGMILNGVDLSSFKMNETIKSIKLAQSGEVGKTKAINELNSYKKALGSPVNPRIRSIIKECNDAIKLIESDSINVDVLRKAVNETEKDILSDFKLGEAVRLLKLAKSGKKEEALKELQQYADIYSKEKSDGETEKFGKPIDYYINEYKRAIDLIKSGKLDESDGDDDPNGGGNGGGTEEETVDLPLIEEVKPFKSAFVKETVDSKEDVLKKFNNDIKKDAENPDDIEHAYQETIKRYEKQYPQYAKEFKAEFDRVDAEERKKLDESLNNLSSGDFLKIDGTEYYIVDARQGSSGEYNIFDLIKPVKDDEDIIDWDASKKSKPETFTLDQLKKKNALKVNEADTILKGGFNFSSLANGDKIKPKRSDDIFQVMSVGVDSANIMRISGGSSSTQEIHSLGNWEPVDVKSLKESRINEVKSLDKEKAAEIFPEFDSYPNISKSGSLTNMRDQHNWDLKNVVQIGSYYYYLKGHPRMKADGTIDENTEEAVPKQLVDGQLVKINDPEYSLSYGYYGFIQSINGDKAMISIHDSNSDGRNIRIKEIELDKLSSLDDNDAFTAHDLNEEGTWNGKTAKAYIAELLQRVAEKAWDKVMFINWCIRNKMYLPNSLAVSIDTSYSPRQSPDENYDALTGLIKKYYNFTDDVAECDGGEWSDYYVSSGLAGTKVGRKIGEEKEEFPITKEEYDSFVKNESSARDLFLDKGGVIAEEEWFDKFQSLVDEMYKKGTSDNFKTLKHATQDVFAKVYDDLLTIYKKGKIKTWEDMQSELDKMELPSNEGMVTEITHDEIKSWKDKKQKVHMGIGSFRGTEYYGIVQNVQQTGQNDYNVFVDVYDKNGKLMGKNDSYAFDYLYPIDERLNEGVSDKEKIELWAAFSKDGVDTIEKAKETATKFSYMKNEPIEAYFDEYMEFKSKEKTNEDELDGVKSSYQAQNGKPTNDLLASIDQIISKIDGNAAKIEALNYVTESIFESKKLLRLAESFRDEIYNDFVEYLKKAGIDVNAKVVSMKDIQKILDDEKLDTIVPEYPAKVLKEKGWTVNEAKTLGKIPTQEYDENIHQSKRQYLISTVEAVFGKKNSYSGSADWGGMPVWTVKGGAYEGTFVLISDNDELILMTREHDTTTEDNKDNVIVQADVDDEKGIREVLKKAIESAK